MTDSDYPKVVREDQIEEAMSEFREAHPQVSAHPMRVRPRLVEAGIEITIECTGLHAVVTLDPNADPDVQFGAIDHLPAAVFAAVGDLARS